MTAGKPFDRNGENAKESRGSKSRWWVLFLAAVLIVGVLLYQWIAGESVKNDLPMPFGYGVAVVLSGSMEPALHVNDFVVAAEKDDYNVGDIVVYQSGQSLTVHRIVARDGDLITTQGDANNTTDEPVPISAVKGAVVLRIPLLGSVIRLVKKPVVAIILLMAVFLLLYRALEPETKKDKDNPEEIKEEIRRIKAQMASEEDNTKQDEQPLLKELHKTPK